MLVGRPARLPKQPHFLMFLTLTHACARAIPLGPLDPGGGKAADTQRARERSERERRRDHLRKVHEVAVCSSCNRFALKAHQAEHAAACQDEVLV